MCRITSTELKNNLSYYLELSSKEDVLIIKDNKVISILTNPRDYNFYEFMKLDGCLKDYNEGKDYDELLGEEILEKHGF